LVGELAVILKAYFKGSVERWLLTIRDALRDLGDLVSVRESALDRHEGIGIKVRT